MDAVSGLSSVPLPVRPTATSVLALAAAAPPVAPAVPGESVELSGAPAVETPEPAPAPAAPPAPASTSAPAPAGSPDTIAMMADTPVSADRDEKFLAKYGPWGVVTGASQGIGAEFARALAEKGMNVVLVARSLDKMQGLAQDLRGEYGVQVRVVPADLSRPDGLETVKALTSDLDVGLLVNNAGSWQFGSFIENDLQKDLGSVALNVEAPMVLSHHFGGKMVESGRGGIVNVGSGAALHGVPGQAAYSATKGFLQNFTESLYQELKPKGVDVLITNPGPVIGEASSAYDQTKVPLQKITARQVATEALDKLGHGSTTIPGWFNRLAMGVTIRAMPRDWLTSIAGYILDKASSPRG